MEKSKIERRITQMEAEGVKFIVNANAGIKPTPAELRKSFDAVVLCGGWATDLRALRLGDVDDTDMRAPHDRRGRRADHEGVSEAAQSRAALG